MSFPGYNELDEQLQVVPYTADASGDAADEGLAAFEATAAGTDGDAGLACDEAAGAEADAALAFALAIADVQEHLL
eukprot:tig00021037_g17473.t1